MRGERRSVSVRRGVDALRAAKHRAFLVRKRLRRLVRPPLQRTKDTGFRVLERVRPFEYDPARYQGEFIVKGCDPADIQVREVPRQVYCFWTGDNALTPNRQRGLDQLDRLNPDLDVVLVTPADLDTFVLPSHPLHPAYEHLSLVHRSDYLRCYAMHHFGGGYVDLKPTYHSFGPSLELLESDKQAWGLGFTEIASDMASQLPGRLGKDLRRHYTVLIGTSSFAFRPATPLTQRWYDEVLRRLELYAGRLATYPGDARGDSRGYPVPWTALLGDILQPLCLRYAERLIHDERVRAQFHDYK